MVEGRVRESIDRVRARIDVSRRPLSRYKGVNLIGFWRLVETDRIIQMGSRPNCQSLADRFEVTRRTAERDIDRLRDLFGAPIEYDPRSRGYYYATSFSLPALKLQEGEAIAVFLGQRLLMQCKGTPFERFVADAMAKMRVLLPADVEISLDDVLDSVSFHSEPLRGEELEVASRYQFIQEAIRRRATISIVYFTAGNGATTHRLIDPYHLLAAHGIWYCIGRCHTRGEVRTFALDRMIDLRDTGDSFEMPADFSVDEYLANSFDLERGEPRIVVIEFDPSESPYIKGRTWHKSQVIEERPDGSLRMTLTVGGMGEIKRWVMSLGSHAWVVEPEDLREQIRRELDEAKGRY